MSPLKLGGFFSGIFVHFMLAKNSIVRSYHTDFVLRGKMTKLEWIIILSSAGLVTSYAVYSFIKSISEDRSSTASIGYIFLPLYALIVFWVIGSAVFSILAMKNIFTGENTALSPSSLYSYGVFTAAVIFFWVARSIQSLSNPALSEKVLEEKYAKYKSSFTLIRSFAETEILQNPAVPTSILEDQVRQNNYNAARHKNLSTESIDRLVRKMSLTHWGILANLCSNSNMGKDTIEYLVSKTSADFKLPQEWKEFQEFVYPHLLVHPNTSADARQKMQTLSGKKE